MTSKELTWRERLKRGIEQAVEDRASHRLVIAIRLLERVLEEGWNDQLLGEIDWFVFYEERRKRKRLRSERRLDQ